MGSLLTMLKILRWAVPIACAGSLWGVNAAGANPKPRASVTVHLSLARQQVVAGTSIAGTATLTNTTKEPITVETCAANGWLEVGLVNRTIHFDPAFTLIGCAPSIVLRPGPNRFPVKVLTTYQSCVQGGGQSTTYIPPCLLASTSRSNDLPPLPAGRYSTKTVTVGLHNVSIANLKVTLLRS
jgi:hypothetical protein